MPTISLPIRPRGVLLKILVRAEPTAAAGPVAAYLDTGASDSVFDQDFLATLGLKPIQRAALHVLGRDGVSFHDAYELAVAIHAPGAAFQWRLLTVLGGPVFQTGAVAALGRDFLAGVAFSYDGPRRRVQLHW